MEDNQENKKNIENVNEKNEETTGNISEEDTREIKKEENPNIENQRQESKEIIEVKSKKKLRRGSSILGTIGAILGGGVAATLWVLLYAFANSMVMPILAILIPIGTYLGYKIFQGKINKKTRVIITIVSLLIIIIVTAIICPAILVIRSSYDLNFENIIGLYSETREKIRNEIIRDLITGIVFTIIGLIVVIKKFIKKEYILEQTELMHELLEKKLKEQSEIIKKACIDLECTSKEKAVKKKKIIEQLKIVYNVKRKNSKLYLKNCASNKLLKKYKGKYYYDETDEKTKIEKVKKMKDRYISPLKVIFIALIISIIVVAIIIYNETNYTVTGTNIKLKINPITQELYGTTKEINEGIGESAAEYYVFIIEEKNEKYEISGQLIKKSSYEQNEIYDMATVIQNDRDYFAKLFGEEYTSKVEDKELGGKKFKSYYYSYISNTEKDCKSQVYLYEAEEQYLWIEARSLREINMTEIDQVIEKLFK